MRVHVTPDRGEWLEWARAAGVHPGVVAYVASDPAIFDHPESNPRAWTSVGRLLRAAEAGGRHDRRPLRAAVVGLVGTARTAAFFKALDGDERPLTAAEILDYRRHRKAVAAWLDAGRLDLVRGSLHALQVHLQARRNYEEARGNAAWAQLGAFLAELPGDLREEAEAFFREHDYDVPEGRRKR